MKGLPSWLSQLQSGLIVLQVSRRSCTRRNCVQAPNTFGSVPRAVDVDLGGQREAAAGAGGAVPAGGGLPPVLPLPRRPAVPLPAARAPAHQPGRAVPAGGSSPEKEQQSRLNLQSEAVHAVGSAVCRRFWRLCFAEGTCSAKQGDMFLPVDGAWLLPKGGCEEGRLLSTRVWCGR